MGGAAAPHYQKSKRLVRNRGAFSLSSNNVAADVSPLIISLPGLVRANSRRLLWEKWRAAALETILKTQNASRETAGRFYFARSR
jgi:hypothetical protein